MQVSSQITVVLVEFFSQVNMLFNDGFEFLCIHCQHKKSLDE